MPVPSRLLIANPMARHPGTQASEHEENGRCIEA
jgi:hypothetical protein